MTFNESKYFSSSDPDERMAMIEAGDIDPLVEIAEHHHGCHPMYEFSTPAFKVVLDGTVEELEQLKNKGLVLDKVYKFTDSIFEGCDTTLLVEAISYDRLDIVDYLFKNGVVPTDKEVSEIALTYPKSLYLLIENGGNVNAVDDEGDTVLHNLCFGIWCNCKLEDDMDVYVEAIKYVLAHGADMNTKNEMGRTAFEELKGYGLGHLLEKIL